MNLYSDEKQEVTGRIFSGTWNEDIISKDKLNLGYSVKSLLTVYGMKPCLSGSRWEILGNLKAQVGEELKQIYSRSPRSQWPKAGLLASNLFPTSRASNLQLPLYTKIKSVALSVLFL